MTRFRPVYSFLVPPETPLVVKGPNARKVAPIHSTLYLLRREIKETGFGAGERTPEQELRGQLVQHRLFATVMLVLAGIDLLAKFALGDKGEAGKRFRAFSRRYLGLSRNHAERLWKVRCSLMHSFGLYTGDGRHVLLGNTLHPSIVTTAGKQKYSLSVSSLYVGFLDSVAKYEAAVQSKKALQKRFSEMCEKYGYLVTGYLAN